MIFVRSYFLCLLVIFGIIVTSCTRNVDKGSDAFDVEGFENVYTKEGILLQKVKRINGDEDRIVRDYYKNGQMFQEIHYVKYKKHGIVSQFYEDGKPYMVTPYENGKINGTVKKYRKDGQLAYEAPYMKDEPCAGLKEYLLDGTLKVKYPKIIITPVDEMLTEELYSLKLNVSDDTKTVEYYEGTLTDGKYIGENADRLHSEKGEGLWSQYVPTGGFYMKQLHFIAKMKTPQGNYYITETSYNLVAENR